MPVYTFQCNDCQRSDDRFLRLADHASQKTRQKCECGGKMRQIVTVPTLAGLDSGPAGFMRGRVENDGCADSFTRERVRKNNGGSLGGGTFVPGLCRPGKQFDNFAVCHSRQEVIDKAKKLGVAVRGPGINVDPRISEAEIKAQEEPYAPSERAMTATIRDEALKRYGGKVPRKKYRELVEELKERHSPAKRPVTRKIDSIYPEGM